MSENDFLWENYESGFDVPKIDVFFDPALKSAVDRSEALVPKLENLAKHNLLTRGIGGDVDRTQKELDGMVRHLIGQPVFADGLVQQPDDPLRDDAPFTSVESIPLVFNGFIVSVRNEKIEIDYYLKAIIDNEGNVLDSRHTVENSIGSVTFQARPHEVRLDFDIKHPLQAYSWLETIAPDVMKSLDTYLISSYEQNAFTSKVLAQLGGFTVTPADYVSTPRAEEQFVNAVNVYVESFIAINPKRTYRVNINGPIIIASSTDEDASYEPSVVALNDKLLMLEQPYLTGVTEPGAEKKQYEFAFNGFLLSSKEEDPARIIVGRLKHLSNIRPIR